MNRSGLQDGYGIGLRKYNRCGDAEYNERIFISNSCKCYNCYYDNSYKNKYN